MKNLFVILLAITLPVFASAQTVRIDSCTATHWAGGFAARQGITYTIYISYNTKHTAIVADSAWSNNQGYAVNIVSLENAARGKRICAEISFTEDHGGIYSPDNANERLTTKPPFNYNGVALIRYKNKGKTRYITLKKTTRIVQVQYP